MLPQYISVRTLIVSPFKDKKTIDIEGIYFLPHQGQAASQEK